MDQKWRERLAEAIQADGRSLRELSRAAGVGENYVQQLLHEAKDPRFQKLQDVLQALGSAATIYVILGFRINSDAESFLREALEMDQPNRHETREDLASLRASASSPKPRRGPRH